MAGLKGRSGGPRLGSGRKPRSAVELLITGNQHTHGRVLAGPGADQAQMIAPIEPFDAPVDLTPEARGIWVALAPHAFQARTLTRATELAFVLLCQTVALERLYGASMQDRGGASHRGLLQRVETGLAAFGLRPFGKPIYEAAPAAPANPLDRFLQKA